jgi:hypothetical protein
MKAHRTPEHVRAAELHMMQIDFDRHVEVVELTDAQALVVCRDSLLSPFWPRAVAKRPMLQRHEVLTLELVK